MLTPSLFNGMPYAGDSVVIPVKMHLYIQALAFVQGLSLRAAYEDCATRFLAEAAWKKGLQWRDGRRPATSDPEWQAVHVRLPSELADRLVVLSQQQRVSLPDVLYTMLYWYSWFLYPPLYERERRKSLREAAQ